MQNIKDGIEGHAVSWYSEVFNILFAELDRDAASKIWEKQLAEKTPKNESHEEDD